MSFKRIRNELNTSLSSGVVSIDGDIATLVSPNINPSGTDTYNIHHGGVARIVDRASGAFEAKVKYITWEPTFGIVPTITNGISVIILNPKGLYAEAVGGPLLSAYSEDLANMNDSVELATFTLLAGNTQALSAAVQWFGNTPNRLAYLMDVIGPLANKFNKPTVSVIPGTLFLQINPGTSLLRGIGFLDNLGAKKGDYKNVPLESPAVIALANRINQVISFGITVNTTDYESSPGVFTPIPPNKSVNGFSLIFSETTTFIGYQLGQDFYGTIDLALASIEQPNISAILFAAFPAIQLGINEGETDLANSKQLDLRRIL